MFLGCELLVSMEVRRLLSPCDTMWHHGRQEEKHVYLVMECCEGGDIGERAGCPRCSEIRISDTETLVFWSYDVCWLLISITFCSLVLCSRFLFPILIWFSSISLIESDRSRIYSSQQVLNLQLSVIEAPPWNSQVLTFVFFLWVNYFDPISPSARMDWILLESVTSNTMTVSIVIRKSEVCWGTFWVRNFSNPKTKRQLLFILTSLILKAY